MGAKRERGWVPASMKKSARGAAHRRVPARVPAMAAAQSDLERARTLYNAGMFDESIAAATVAKKKPAAAPSATLIAARARLELFRQSARSPGPGCRARGSCFTESTHSGAAGNHRVADWPRHRAVPRRSAGTRRCDVHDRVAEPRAGCRLAEFDKLLEWWASTLSRVAESLSGLARKDAYAAMLAAVRGELERDPLSRPATYWLGRCGARHAAMSTVPGTRPWPAGFAPVRSLRGSSFAAISTASSPRRSSPSGRSRGRASASMRKRP